MKNAKVTITDIKEKNGMYMIGVKIKAGRYSFHKAIAIRPVNGDIKVKDFKMTLKNTIIKEVKHRKAVEPIKRLQKDTFIVEYD